MSVKPKSKPMEPEQPCPMGEQDPQTSHRQPDTLTAEVHALTKTINAQQEQLAQLRQQVARLTALLQDLPPLAMEVKSPFPPGREDSFVAWTRMFPACVQGHARTAPAMPAACPTDLRARVLQLETLLGLETAYRSQSNNYPLGPMIPKLTQLSLRVWRHTKLLRAMVLDGEDPKSLRWSCFD